jgi:hypothetical protein
MAKKKTSAGKRKSKSEASSNDATTTSQNKRRWKRKSEKADDIMIIPLGDHQDLIVPLIMDFLDVPTLVSLGSTNKKNQGHLSEQVAQRKSRFKSIQDKISNELLSATNLLPSREEVHQALSLREEACRLIDSGLGWVDHGYIDGDEYDFTNVCCVCSQDRLFVEERKFLTPHRSGDIAEHFLMLPTSFYLSKYKISEASSTDAGTLPSEEMIKNLKDGPLSYLWHAEDHMGAAHEMTAFSPFFQDGLFPLRIFMHRNSGFFTEIVYEVAERIVDMGQLEAFRVAACRFVKECPHSLPCLLLALVVADQSVAAADDAADGLLSDLCEQTLWWSDVERN